MRSIVAYSMLAGGQYLCLVSSCRNLAAEDLLNWLIFSSGPLTSSQTKVVWDLPSFVRSVLEQLPAGTRGELSRPPYRARWGNYRLFHLPEKVFSANKNGLEANFYDLSQYYPGEPEPATVEDLQSKADQLSLVLSELGIERPRSLSSPVACFRDHPVISSVREAAVPTLFDAGPDQLGAHEIALACTPREWVVNYQIGHFPELWKYDVSSSYPYWATKLPDLRQCDVVQADGVDPASGYGFFVGDFTVYPDHPLAFCSPFLADRGDGVLVNFTGTVPDYPCSLDEVRCLHGYGLGEFRFKRGWSIIPQDDNLSYPFAAALGTLYDLRGESPLKSHLIKRVMNGIIGRLLETRMDEEGNVLEYGSSFNPLYHAMTTIPARLQVFSFIVQGGFGRGELVHVGVDGVRATRHVPLPGCAPMGGWRCSGVEPAFVLSPGAIVSPDRDFKGTGYASLLRECEGRPGASRVGDNREGPIDVRRLFLSQTRGFVTMPERAGDLLRGPYLSEPVLLGS